MAASGYRERFPPPRLRGGCGFQSGPCCRQLRPFVGRHRPAFLGQLADNLLQNLAAIRERFLAGIAPTSRRPAPLTRGHRCASGPRRVRRRSGRCRWSRRPPVLLGFMPPLYHIGAVPPPWRMPGSCCRWKICPSPAIPCKTGLKLRNLRILRILRI
jgi:hypothetical protein